MILPRWNSILLTFIVLLWTGVVVAGMTALTEYAYKPGKLGETASYWPADSRIFADSDLPTLVMFAHPRCPCTRASISELAVLMSRAQGSLRGKVVFLQPRERDSSWSRTDLWSAASIIPNVQVVADLGGDEFRRFGATTSGQVLVFDRRGRLIFLGGITSARGHAGDNLGRESILRLLTDASNGQSRFPAKVTTPVFGCSLSD